MREPLQRWHTDASHNQGLKKLVYRIKNRAVRLGFEEMVGPDHRLVLVLRTNPF